HPNRCSLLKFTEADLLSHEVPWLLNPGVYVDEDIRVPERPAGKYRNSDQRLAGNPRNGERRERNFGCVEIIVVEHPGPDLQVRKIEPVQLETFRFDRAVHESMSP